MYEANTHYAANMLAADVNLAGAELKFDWRGRPQRRRAKRRLFLFRLRAFRLPMPHRRKSAII